MFNPAMKQAVQRYALHVLQTARAAVIDSRKFGQNPDAVLGALGCLFNASDYVLDMPALLLGKGAKQRARYTAAWHDALHIRTCEQHGTPMHDSHAVLDTYGPLHEQVDVVCEPCAEFWGIGERCSICGMRNPTEDMTNYIPCCTDVSTADVLDMSRACIHCAVPAETRRFPSAPCGPQW